MKVFISWSGTHSEKIAAEIRDWLPSVLQSVEPYFTPDDVEKGARWLRDIAEELAASEVGLLCLTRDSLESHWLMFEAGALSKSIDKARVCPLLFGVTNADLAGPLEQFQTTHFKKGDFKKLMQLVNTQLGEHAIAEKRLDAAFEKWWPDLETKIKTILEEGEESEGPVRTDRELLEEVVENTRRLASSRSRPEISPKALMDLMTKFIALHDEQAAKDGSYQQTLDGMHRMTRPIDFLARKVYGSSEEFNEVYDRFAELTYKVGNDDEDFPPEEDPPF